MLEVKRYKKQLKEGVDGFIEEAVVRRELSDNFCYYQENYDRVEGAYQWAITTLNNHKWVDVIIWVLACPLMSLATENVMYLGIGVFPGLLHW